MREVGLSTVVIRAQWQPQQLPTLNVFGVQCPQRAADPVHKVAAEQDVLVALWKNQSSLNRDGRLVVVAIDRCLKGNVHSDASV